MKQLTDFMRTFLPWASRQCRYSALSLMLLIGASALAQGIAVKGTVVDSNGDPLIGASVVIKGNTSVGTITDFDGNFSLSVPSETYDHHFRELRVVSQGHIKRALLANLLLLCVHSHIGNHNGR